MGLKFPRSLLLLASAMSLLLAEHQAMGAVEKVPDVDSRCSADTFRCQTALSGGTQCITLNWVCDGDEDCLNGEDEANCENPTCPPDQFLCSSGVARCISLGWQCDGENDCDDGADEKPELCHNRKTKGVHDRGPGLPFIPPEIHFTITNALPEGDQVDQFQCLPYQYRCPGTLTCISYHQLCDDTTDCPDGADEGGHCRNGACSRKHCTDECKETIQGAECFCRNDYQKPNGSICQDLNECEYGKYCDQNCKDFINGYNCTCQDGYILVNKSRCIVDPGLKEPRLFIANQTTIQQLSRDGGELRQPSSMTAQGTRILAFDINVANNSVCWISDGSAMTCGDIDGRRKTWTVAVMFSLEFVKQMSKDWVSGNWYFADEVKEQIFLCTSDGSYCMSVIHNGVRRPKCLALDPTKGYMFYADWSTSSKVSRADLDGNNPKDLVTKKIVHPHGITLDFALQHLYWGDSFLDYIERVDYNGNGRQVILPGVKVHQVFSVALLENDLYFINHQNRHSSIIRLHRDGVFHPQSGINITMDGPVAFKIFHQVRQPQMPEKICEKKNCSHLCIPVPQNGHAVAKCICKAGYTLFEERECKRMTVDAYLLYTNAQQGTVRSVAMDFSISEDVQEPIHNLLRPVALAVDPRNNDIYYSDVKTLQIGRHNTNGTDPPTVLLGNGVGATSCEGLAVDWIGNNLYWTDVDHRSIFAASLSNLSLITHLVSSNLTHPKSIVLDPENGMMYWADWAMRPAPYVAKIECARMDGTERRTLTRDVQWPNSLFLDKKENILYWTEAYYDRIQGMFLSNGTILNGSQVPLQYLDHPYGMVFHDGTFYWTESLKGQVRSFRNDTGMIILRNDSKPIFNLVPANSQHVNFSSDHPCIKAKRCSDLCIPTGPGTYICMCALGRTLKSDNKTCEGNLGRLTCNANSQFQCHDGSCIPITMKCNGFPQCLDKSDEDSNTCGNTTCENYMFSCDINKCIYQQFVCDGEYDCLDHSDERADLCEDRKCPGNYTRCASNNHCIPNTWKCDGEKDCQDGSDENPEECHFKSRPCTPHEFQCLSGRCIPHTYRCDNEYDCDDHTDEAECSHWCDPDREFKCKDGSTCLPISYLCDGERNCPDGTDELKCLNQQVICEASEFMCIEDRSCIPNLARCDGIGDCVNSSDEVGCDGVKIQNLNDTNSCHWSEFKCDDGSRCIPSAWKCDGDNDCADRSDERHCSFFSSCLLPNFLCLNHSYMCLPPEKVCNNIFDCPDHSDEGRLCEYDNCLNNDCSDVCYTFPEGFVCGCFKGRTLLPDNKTCTDIDICDQWGACSQKCTKVPAGKKCECYSGYSLMSDGYSCKADGDDPVHVIFSRRHEIRQQNVRTLEEQSLVTGLRNTIGMDFLWEKKWLFWTDVGDDKIYRGTILPNTVTDIHRIVDVGLSTTEGIAVDWVAGNIYWVESNLDQIEVAKWDGSNRTTLLAGSMHSPRALALDPRDGLLFWTDWDGEMPRIERVAMSGQRETRQIIFDIRNVSGSGWPNGLALDYENRRLYWVDARSDSVHCTKYDGSGHQLIVTSHEYLSHPFSLTVFEHYIYWTDWRLNGVIRANKFNGSGIEVLQKTYTQPFDIKVFHPFRQPKVEKNPCENNGGCSNLCLLGLNGTSVCACPHRFKLGPDNKTCEKDDTFLLYVKEHEIRGVDLSYAYYNVIPSITLPFVENASAIDYDVQADRLYWTDRNRNVITSAFLNGTGIQTVIDTGLSNPEGFAIDWLSRNMYFTSYDKNEASISVANLDGAYRQVIFSSKENSKPNSMVIHPRKGLMFWSDIGGSIHRIMRANMDGTNVTEFATNLTHPASLTLDMEEEKLYWVSRNEAKVLYCPLSQSCKNPSEWISSVDLNISLFSMAIYHKTVYFASNSSITKIDQETQTKMTWTTDTQPISAMQIYNPKIRRGDGNGCTKNNGGCQQLCLPLPGNPPRICRCTSGFDLGADGKTCLGVYPFILYSTESKIRGMKLHGDVTPEVLAPVSRTSLAASVDFYAKEDMIYWVDTNIQTISRIKRDLSQRENIITDGISRVESLAVDWVAGNIYWVDRGHHAIQVARLDGSHRYVIIHDNLDKPRNIAVDPKNGYLYYTETGSFPRIIRAKLDGSERENFVVSQLKTEYEEELPVLLPEGLAIDFAENMLYWCDRRRDVIEKVNITSRIRKVVVSSGLVDCRALAVYGDYVYWADQTESGGSIKRFNKTHSSQIEIIATHIDKLQDIKIFNVENDFSNPCSDKNGGCEELCLYIGGNSTTCACSHGRVAKDNKSCEDYDAFLLYSKVTSIESLHLSNKTDLNSPREPLQNEQKMQNVIGLAYDFDTQRVFFSDIQRGDICSVFFNNTGYNQIVRNVGSVEGLAFDPMHQVLYWTSYTNSSINYLNFKPQDTALNVLQPNKLVQLSSSDHPRAIVVNPCIKRLFWTNWNDHQPAIQTVQFNGHNAHSIISEDIRTPNGLTIDYAAQKLYWSDARLDKIERCDYDGSNRVVIVTSVPQHSFGMTVHGDFLYWTDWVLRAVLRANKYDGTGLTWLSKNLQRQPMGIIAVDKEVRCEKDPCHLNAFGCDEICSVLADGTPECRCFKGHALLSDKKRCVVEGLQELCQDDDFICHSKYRCIPLNATCNGIIDCMEDGSDENELFCLNRECPASYFRCTDAQGLHRCIEMHHVCDGAIDCADASDEEFCPCHEDEFRCNNGMCIKAKYRCDHDSDCPDHSDEIGCNFDCSGLQTLGAKHEELVSCNTTSMCIYPSWICDRSNDCWDSNDEKNCNYTNKECLDNISCNDGTCILPQWRCDKDYDCADRSDEANCTYKCEKDQVACNDSMCVPSTWICDSLQDCSDHSDEQNCDHRKCNNETEFQCSSGRCIPLEWKCDGDTDCNDGADERVDIAGCMPVKCDWDQFQCLNRQCIRSIFYCDGDNDCGDFSDEPESCVYENCTAEEFKCSMGHKCISAEQRCNKMYDCPDHSDEINCTETELVPCGNSSFFQCGDGTCISQSLLCNNNSECPDSSDEPSICNVNECKFFNGGCHQICVDKILGFECQCRPGYELQSNKRDCKDIDECTTLYPCSHFCENQPESFTCSCAEGYALDRNKTSCKSVKSPKPRLLLANRYYIRLVNMTTGSSAILFSNLTNAVAVDYDWKEQYVYWTDITSFNSSINRMPFNNTFHKMEPQVLHSSTVRNPDGLAIDWVGRNLYWCDKTTDTIEVSRLDGRYRLVLLREGLEEPRGLEVFPQRGLLFYSDWGDTPHIGRLNMNGTNHTRIIEGNLAWPNALTIDYVTGTIFWADGNLDYIGMADVDGKNRRVVIAQDHVVPHIFAIATFENRLYWTDWGRHAVTYADKFSGLNVKNLTTLVHRPMDIQVVHPLRQVPVLDAYHLDPCERLQCSHLCLLRPVVINGINAVVGGCACPENHYLALDNRQCISNCTSSQVLCGTASKCIPFWWQCDGHRDCEDGSDEPETCGKYYCQQRGMYQCQNASNSGDCLPPYQICDGQMQCSNGSDELLCESYQCLQHYMKCKADKKCIPETQRCDNHNHCSDGEDEKDCMNKTCSPNQFQCNNTRCVPFVWRCDNDNDCGDGSDEPENCRALECQEAHFKCNRTGRCIPQAWMCDGDNDCGDQDYSDEMSQQCHQKTCDPTYFKCTNGHCIPGRWHCDFYDDCKDGSDEAGCQRKNCSETEFRCEDGKCIPRKLQCDRNVDCSDHSDERNCDSNCTAEEFKCKNVEHCVPLAWRCDGDTDCADGTDEWNCQRTCPPGEFQCNNSICQPLLWRCDGDNDCGDHSDEDEHLCASFSCAPGRFRCTNHICIWNSMVCDGNNDCDDGLDENNITCSERNRCVTPNIQCPLSYLCLPPSKLCNNITDCSTTHINDQSDEDPAFCRAMVLYQNCSENRGGCDHTCHQMEYGVICSCKKGFELADDGHTCTEINPCNKWGTCSQLCKFDNQTHTHNCSCDKGYQSSGLYCLAPKDAPPSLLVAMNATLHRDVLRSAMETPSVEVELHTGQKIISMDVDMNGNEWQIFYSVHNRQENLWHIYKKTISSNGSNRNRRDASPTKIYNTTNEIRGLSVDWISRRLYWVDATQRVIRVAEYTGIRSKVVVNHTQLHSPPALVVDAAASKLYWTDRGLFASISCSNLDGSSRVTLVDKDIYWPIDLALDSANGRLYWVDIKKYTLETVSMIGKDRHVVHKFPASEPPLALDVFENSVFVLVSGSDGSIVLELDKFLGRNHSKMYLPDHTHDIVVAHPLKQKKVDSACDKSACKETQVCFNLPDGHTSCLCPDGAVIDGKRCSFQKPCPPDYCMNNGTCFEKLGVSKCSCPPNFQGEHCEISRILCSQDPCLNGGTCFAKPYGFSCECLPGFLGDTCEQCVSHYCANGGKCVQEGWQQKCKCLDDFDPATNCRFVTCAKSCQSGNTPVNISRQPECDCNCPPSFTARDCNNKCINFCHNKAVCSIDHDTQEPRCMCDEFYSGDMCEKCKCEPGGKCLDDSTEAITSCRCKDGYSGHFCESFQTTTQSQSGIDGLLVGIPLAAAVAVIVLLIIFIVVRRKRRESQYNHKRMLEGGELNVSNPVYMRKDPDDEDDDEMEPLGARDIYTGNSAANFGNPIYDMYATTGDSTQKLLQEAPMQNEEQELLESGLPVRYFGTNEGTHTKTKKYPMA